MALVVWLPLNKGEIKNQGTGDFSYSGTPSFVDGKFGKGLSYTPGINCHSSALNGAKQFTIAFWANTTACTIDWSGIWGFVDYDSSGKLAADFRMEASTESTRAGSFHNNEPYGITKGSRILMDTKGVWYHCALVVDGNYLKSYVNGKLKFTDSILGGYISGDFHLGSWRSGFSGILHDFRVYDEPLSQKDIHELSKGLVLHYPFNDLGQGNPNVFSTSKVGLSGGYYSSQLSAYDSSFNGYTITSPKGSGTWGNGFKITGGRFAVPYGEYYRVSMEVWVPTEKAFAIDFNNDISGGGAWNGNDNDDDGYRFVSPSNHILPANTWTKVSWGTRNTHSKNTNKVPIYPYDGFGIVTTNDTSSTTWKIRNFKIEYGNETSPYSLPQDSLGGPVSSIKDCSGFNNNGTLHGNLGFKYLSAPRYNTSLNVNGDGHKNDYINTSLGIKSSGVFTVATWVRTTTGYAQTFQTYTSNTTSLGTNGLWLCVNTEGSGFWSYNSAYCKAYDPIHTQTWYHAVYTYNNGIAKWYINGLLANTVDMTKGGKSVDLTNLYLFNAHDYSVTWNTTFVGALCDYRVYMTELSASDVYALYNTSAHIDNNGTFYGYELIED